MSQSTFQGGSVPQAKHIGLTEHKTKGREADGVVQRTSTLWLPRRNQSWGFSAHPGSEGQAGLSAEVADEREIPADHRHGKVLHHAGQPQPPQHDQRYSEQPRTGAQDKAS